jgi:hypothetical protein
MNSHSGNLEVNALYYQQQINPTCLPAQNFKDFYGIYLNWMQTGQLDSISRITVNIIADECPIVGGTVVFSARKFLEWFDNIFIWHDDEICIEPQNRFFEQTASKKPFEISVYPNPANEMVTINSPGLAGYTLSDLTGKIISDGSFNEGLNQINTKEYAEGIYLLTVRLKDELISHKISVNHF